VWIKIIILVLLALMLYSLFSGLFYLVKDRGQGTRTLKALTARISIWVLLFVALCIGLYTGVITPSNSVRPPLAQPATSK
jgi:succinate dehydrogenase/fumarate reductase cytochrome b subunit